MEKETRQPTPTETEESVNELLKKYLEQGLPEGVHTYSELLHRDYGNYSDSCCC